MPQDFACKWLLIMGFIAKLSTRGHASTIPLTPPQQNICQPFVSDRELKNKGYEFSSPGYNTKKYPNHTDCVRVLAAPAANKIISLDFRDKFHIEPSSDCTYDYLEIRDGPYGFSPGFEKAKTRFCGSEFPMEGAKITSSGQFLWLRFRSDNSIQHNGFKAVYEFQSFRKSYTSQELTCRTPVTLEDDSKTLNQNNYPPGYLAEQKQNGRPIDCTFDITSKDGTSILIHFDKLNFTRDNHCGKSFVEVYDGYTLRDRHPGFTEQFCKNTDKMIVSRFNRVVVRTVAKQHSQLPVLKITITALSPAPCRVSQYSCKAKKEEKHYCIKRDLRCNNMINCPGLDDEQCKPGENIQDVKDKLHPTPDDKSTKGKGSESGTRKEKKVPYHYIILGIIGALLCFFILICMIITVRQRRSEMRNRRRDELLRRSSDDQRYLQQQGPAAAQQQSPHSLRRDMHTPSSLEGNRLMDMNQRAGPPDTASIGRLTKQNGAVMMGGAGGSKGASHALPNAAIAATSSSAYYDPRAMHSTRIGKYLAVPNPPAHPDDEELCLGISPVEQVGQARIAYEDLPPSPPQHACDGGCGAGGRGSPMAGPSGARCKVHGEVYQRDMGLHAAHQPIIHRSDSAPSKAFFRVGSVTPPPGPIRIGAATPPSYRQHGPPQPQHYEGRHYSGDHPQYHASSGRSQRDPYYRDNTDEHIMVSSVHRPRSQPYAPAPAYSLHNLPVAARDDDEDSAPCTCRHHEPPAPHYASRDREPPQSVVRQASLGTPRSLRRKIYET